MAASGRGYVLGIYLLSADSLLCDRVLGQVWIACSLEQQGHHIPLRGTYYHTVTSPASGPCVCVSVCYFRVNVGYAVVVVE